MEHVQDIRPEDLAVSVLGRGVSFPFRVDRTNGGVVISEGQDHVRESVVCLMHVNPGEMPGRLDFGIGLGRFVFDLISSSTETRIALAVADGLLRDEPRVRDPLTIVTRNPSEPEKINVAVSYKLRLTSREDRVIEAFPSWEHEAYVDRTQKVAGDAGEGAIKIGEGISVGEGIGVG
jgi:phage baseplate assembly protein W